jgi:predicted ribonuclease toxin of YeeF-YezG toxin-antitoxin module
MSNRLQVLLDEQEFREIKRVAKQHRMTVAEWVRQVLREARRGISTMPIDHKLKAVREATLHAYPTGDIDQITAEIERGYREGPE